MSSTSFGLWLRWLELVCSDGILFYPGIETCAGFFSLSLSLIIFFSGTSLYIILLFINSDLSCFSCILLEPSTNLLIDAKLEPLQCCQRLKRPGKLGPQCLCRRKILLQLNQKFVIVKFLPFRNWRNLFLTISEKSFSIS